MTDDFAIASLDLQLSDEEIYLIGMVISHWGTLEHELFNQVLATYQSEEAPPTSLNNLQFTETLRLWRDRVLSALSGARRESLEKALQEIERLKNPRDALAHGMWHWSPLTPHVISTVRVKKREIITTQFDIEALREISRDLAALNFRVRYPAGAADLAAERAETGFHISRKGFELLFGKPAKASGDQ